MASPHSANFLHLLIAKGTIDEYVISVLMSKSKVFSLILGDTCMAGLLENKEILNLDSGMEDVKEEEEFKSLLKAFVKSVPMSDFLKGEFIETAQTEEGYQMTFNNKLHNNKKKDPPEWVI